MPWNKSKITRYVAWCGCGMCYLALVEMVLTIPWECCELLYAQHRDCHTFQVFPTFLMDLFEPAQGTYICTVSAKDLEPHSSSQWSAALEIHQIVSINYCSLKIVLFAGRFNDGRSSCIYMYMWLAEFLHYTVNTWVYIVCVCACSDLVMEVIAVWSHAVSCSTVEPLVCIPHIVELLLKGYIKVIIMYFISDI